MPPRKPAAAKSKDKDTDDDASMLIVEYLCVQNRPYSATDVSSNLHNKVTKTKTDKLLKEMFERGEIGGRASGKQWVYWAVQDPKDSATPSELADLDTRISTLREALPSLKSDVKSKTALLSSIKSAPTTDALRDAVAALEDEKAEKVERLKVLRSGSVKPVGKEEKEKTEREYRGWMRKREARKRAFREVEGYVLDTGVVVREELWEKLDFEDDP